VFPAKRPQNVVIHKKGGVHIPCELTYRGVEKADDGKDVHVWETLTEFNLRDGDRMTIGMMPARSRIQFPTDDLEPEDIE